MNSELKIVFLDGYTLNPGDLDTTALLNMGAVTVYDTTTPDQLVDRAGQADIIITNKFVMDEKAIDKLPNLKYIIVAATGYNNVDISAAQARNVKVSNVSGYSTTSVSQHVFAMLLSYLSQCATYFEEARDKTWTQKGTWSYWHNPILEVEGKVFGILGLGTIGQSVAKIALAMGMAVIASHKHPQRDQMEGVTFVELDELFAQSDVLSLHAPLNASTNEIINKATLSKMKGSAILINTARGGLINELDLKWALENKEISTALLDVLSAEPPPEDHPLLALPNCHITPHQAWASQASRGRLLQGIVDNVKGYLSGKMQNLVE